MYHFTEAIRNKHMRTHTNTHTHTHTHTEVADLNTHIANMDFKRLLLHMLAQVMIVVTDLHINSA